jgi:hypothetical protein
MMRRTKERPSILTAEQVETIYSGLINAAMHGAATAARLSEMAWELAESLDIDTPDLIERLKPITALAKVVNAAMHLPLALIKAGMIPFPTLDLPSEDAPIPKAIPKAPVELACLPPLARVG